MNSYPTGWAGDLTFEQIAEKVGPLMAKKINRFGLFGQESKLVRHFVLKAIQNHSKRRKK